MEQIKAIFTSHYMVVPIWIAKLIFFYCLVKVQGVELVLAVAISLGVLCLLFHLLKRKYTKGTVIAFSLIYIVITGFMFADALYYDYFSQFTSVNQIFQLESLFVTNDEVEVSQSISVPISVLLLVDVPFVIAYFIKGAKEYARIKRRKKKPIFPQVLALLLVVVIGINPFGLEALSRLNHVEYFTYHTKDLQKNLCSLIYEKNMSKEEVLTVINEQVPKTEGSLYKGIGKGKNLIVVQMESFQNFPIGKKYNGQVITPNLNQLLQKDSIYYSNYYQGIGKGNTADAEFTSMNSLYPVIEGESYRLFVDNTFNGLPWHMQAEGYETMVFHGYKKDFWNRSNAYVNQGFETFYSEEKLKMTEKSGFGLTDKEMFKQAVEILATKKQPTFSFMITLTNHTPYILDDSLTNLELKEEDKGTMFGHYLQSIRYTDEAIGVLIEELKEKGLYEDTVIAFYGDHHGLNAQMKEVNQSVSDFLGYEYDYNEMLHIPLIIHLPNSGICEKIETVGGQVDFFPTIANIMGVKLTNPYIFGKDLSNATEGYVASVAYLLEGSYYGEDYLYQIGRDGGFSSGRCIPLDGNKQNAMQGTKKHSYNSVVSFGGYDKLSKDKIKANSERAKKLLQASKAVLKKDMMK